MAEPGGAQGHVPPQNDHAFVPPQKICCNSLYGNVRINAMYICVLGASRVFLTLAFGSQMTTLPD